MHNPKTLSFLSIHLFIIIVIEADFSPPTSPTFLPNQIHLLEQQQVQQQQQQLNNLFGGGVTVGSSTAASSFNNNTATILANTAALYSYATASAAGIPVPDHVAQVAALYNRVIMNQQQQIPTVPLPTVPTPNSTSISGGSMRPTAALHAARLVQRPLGRTQSAPLPLGHPALLQNGCKPNASTSSTSSNSNSNNSNNSSTSSGSGGASSLVKQQIRAAVLTRASSKSQVVENVEEETEAAVAAEMNDDHQSSMMKEDEDITDQVIDLTAKPRHGSTGSNPETTTTTSAFSSLRHNNSNDFPNNFHQLHHSQPHNAIYGSTAATLTGSAGNILLHNNHQPPHQLHQAAPTSSLFQTSLIHPSASVTTGIQPNTSLLEGSSLAAALYQRSILAAAIAASSNSSSSIGGTNLISGSPSGGSSSATSASAFRSPFFFQHQHHPIHYHHHHLIGNTHPGRPLSRTLSSPQVMLSHHHHHASASSNHSSTANSPNSPGTRSPDIIGSGSPLLLTQQQQFTSSGTTPTSSVVPVGGFRYTTALVYDSFMQKHQCNCSDAFQHPEHGGRLQSIWARLTETGLTIRCEVSLDLV